MRLPDLTSRTWPSVFTYSHVFVIRSQYHGARVLRVAQDLSRARWPPEFAHTMPLLLGSALTVNTCLFTAY